MSPYGHIRGCQNDGPFLGPLNTGCRIFKKDHSFDNHPHVNVLLKGLSNSEDPLGAHVASAGSDVCEFIVILAQTPWRMQQVDLPILKSSTHIGRLQNHIKVDPFVGSSQGSGLSYFSLYWGSDWNTVPLISRSFGSVIQASYQMSRGQCSLCTG